MKKATGRRTAPKPIVAMVPLTGSLGRTDAVRARAIDERAGRGISHRKKKRRRSGGGKKNFV